MNVVETYVTNITKEELKYHKDYDFEYYEIVADTDCYGVKRKQVQMHLLKDEYEHIKKYGFYYT